MPNPREEDVVLATSLHPKRLTDHVGQGKVKDLVKISIAAAQQRGEALDHILFCGLPGLVDKTTLAYIMAAEMGVNIRITSGPAIERPTLYDILVHVDDFLLLRVGAEVFPYSTRRVTLYLMLLNPLLFTCIIALPAERNHLLTKRS